MRARNIKPGLFKNEELGTADPLYTLVFEGLWTLADREGRLEDRPLRIHAEINPYRTALGTEQALDWLVVHRFIHRYRVGDRGYIWIPAFLHHQNPHVREPPSKLPAPEKPYTDQGNGEAQVLHGANLVQAPVQHKSGPSDSGFRIPDSGSLIPDSGFPTTKLRSSSAVNLFTSSSGGLLGGDSVKKRSDRNREKLRALVNEIADAKAMP